MNKIHPTAIVGPEVVLGDRIEIHPYAVIDGRGTIGDGCKVYPHVHITGWFSIGNGTAIHAGAVIGDDPQDYSYSGEKGLVEIGSNCLLREGVTIHTPVHGSQGEKTILGNGVFMMTNTHAGHNAKIGDNSVLASGCVLGGYVNVEENAFLSGNVAVHQFCRIGGYAIVGGVTKIAQDVPPYAMVDGSPPLVHGINVVGLKRRGIGQEERTKIKDAFKILYSGKGIKDCLLEIESKYASDEMVLRLVRFVRESKRGITGSSYGG